MSAPYLNSGPRGQDGSAADSAGAGREESAAVPAGHLIPPPGVASGPVAEAVAALRAGATPEPNVLRAATRALLTALAAKAPGRTVEVRVPPYGAVQCVSGPRHTRGTPPNVVEMDPITWLEIATASLTWHDAVAKGRVSVSGVRGDLSDHLPIVSAGNEN